MFRAGRNERVRYRKVNSRMKSAFVLAASGLAVCLATVALQVPHSEPMRTRVLVKDLAEADEFIAEVLASLDNRWLAVRVSKVPRDSRIPAHEGRTIVFDTHTHSVRKIEEGRYYSSMLFSPVNKHLIILNRLGRIEEYDLLGGRRRTVMDDRRRYIETQGDFTAVSADGTVIAVGETMINDPEYRAVDLATGEAMAFREGDYFWTGATISRNGRLIATGGWPGWSPRIFDRKTGERVGYCLHDKYAGPSCVAFSPDARHLACTYPDGTLVVYDLTTAQGHGAVQVLVLPGFESVTCLSFDSSGRRLVCGLLDGSVELRPIHISDTK